jgi:HAT1-interacting factor 1
VIGKPKDEEDDDGPVGNKFSFAEPSFDEGDDGDQEGEEQAEGGEEGQGGEEEGEGEGEGGDEPEDDYNAAWEVLDVARTIYIKVLEDNKGEEMREEKLRLADTYLALADVSCETGKLRYMSL